MHNARSCTQYARARSLLTTLQVAQKNRYFCTFFLHISEMHALMHARSMLMHPIYVSMLFMHVCCPCARCIMVHFPLISHVGAFFYLSCMFVHDALHHLGAFQICCSVHKVCDIVLLVLCSVVFVLLILCMRL